jgi:hypothetical protein
VANGMCWWCKKYFDVDAAKPDTDVNSCGDWVRCPSCDQLNSAGKAVERGKPDGGSDATASNG